MKTYPPKPDAETVPSASEDASYRGFIKGKTGYERIKDVPSDDNTSQDGEFTGNLAPGGVLRSFMVSDMADYLSKKYCEINMMIDYDRDKRILIAIGIVVVILVSLFIATRVW